MWRREPRIQGAVRNLAGGCRNDSCCRSRSVHSSAESYIQDKRLNFHHHTPISVIQLPRLYLLLLLCLTLSHGPGPTSDVKVCTVFYMDGVYLLGKQRTHSHGLMVQDEVTLSFKLGPFSHKQTHLFKLVYICSLMQASSAYNVQRSLVSPDSIGDGELNINRWGR